jgi:imidazoleglycerol phosphate synthase glutamine amidotransferase subunit HisH
MGFIGVLCGVGRCWNSEKINRKATEGKKATATARMYFVKSMCTMSKNKVTAVTRKNKIIFCIKRVTI